MKYILTRKDGKPIPESARFFVLRLDRHGKSETEIASMAVCYYATKAREAGHHDEARAAEHALMGGPEPVRKYPEDGR